ncbi:MAG: hypothetical protein P3W96_003045 [Halomonas sp.]|nr:hypothetical protein [Halomonas sp.]MDM7480980.1 hypothetical protein [Halomonas sp.]
MGVALKLYEQLTDAGEDKARARLIAEAFEALESRYPQLSEVATQANLRETELKLQKEIKEVEGRLQKEIKEVEGRLQKEIESVRLEIKEVEGKLRLEIEAVRLEIKNVEVRLTQAIHRQTRWVVLAVGGVTGLIRWLDVVLK